jgi:hypothetical protein
MVSHEARLPREVFSKKLSRICGRLDDASTRIVKYQLPCSRRAVEEEVTVAALWVVGSYARGARFCGDLDVVLQLTQHKPALPITALSRTFFGTLPYLRYSIGTPGENSSDVEFPDAVQVWSGLGCDWRGAIGQIAPCPLAGRAPRQTDSIPLRLEQIRFDYDDLLALVALERAGTLRWAFVEFGPEWLLPIPPAEQSDNERNLEKCTRHWGRKSRALLPALLRLMRGLDPGAMWSNPSSGASLICGSTLLAVGRPNVSFRRMTQGCDIRQVAVVPHLSARGPNGVWLIRRNDKLTLPTDHEQALFSPSSGAPRI